MEYRAVADSGLEVSTVGLGTVDFGDRLDESAAQELVSAALHLGINLLHRAIDRLEATYVGEGKGALYAAIKGVLGQKGGGPRYQEVASQLGVSATGASANW